MTDITEGSFMASKLKADELQIKMEEPKPAETTKNLRVYQMNNMPQRILLWLMVIITLLNTGIFSSGIISSCVMMFANVTSINYPPNIVD